MKKLMGEQLNQRDIDEIIRDVDLNGDGQVDFEGQGGFTYYWYKDWIAIAVQTALRIKYRTIITN